MSKRTNLFPNICCTCVQENGTLIHINTTDEGVRLSEKLRSVIPEIDFEVDGFPNSICTKCCVKLKDAYTFKQLCMNSKNWLTTYKLQQREAEMMSYQNCDAIYKDKHRAVQVKREPDDRRLSENDDYDECIPYELVQVQMDRDDEPAEPDGGKPVEGAGAAAACTKSGKATEAVTCHWCAKTFCNKYSLLTHLRSHTGEKPFKCGACTKTFRYHVDLTRHTKTHTGEKPFRCKECGKGFIRKTHLTNHMRVHTGEKPFRCALCHQCFKQDSGLKSHMRTHAQRPQPAPAGRLHPAERPHRCPACHKAFAYKSWLLNHARSHDNDAKFKCKVCGKCLPTENQLNLHSIIHIGEKTSLCFLCGQAFYTRSGLQDHKATHHR